jgi:hypothetical protein
MIAKSVDSILYKSFALYIESTRHLIVPHIGDGHIRAQFPNAEVLTAVSWDKNGVYYNMNRKTFPNVKRINYLCGSPGGYTVLGRFFDGCPEFKWGLYGYPHRFFRDLTPECIAKLTEWEAKMYHTIASNDLYCDLWRLYLDDDKSAKDRSATTHRPTPPSALS